MTVDTLPLPTYGDATVVVPAPDSGPGNWSGAASAVLVDGTFWLTYRVRRPLTEGRGVAVVVARSDDGVAFTPVTEVARETFGCESFERPVLVPVAGLGWRLYLSCATYDSKHWWIDSLTAPTVAELPAGHQQVVLPGDERLAVKDPVIQHPTGPGEEWVMWLCCHPLTEPGHEDRMTTRRLTSPDGLAWTDRGEVLAGRPGHWDARGARVTAVLSPDAVLYDGRPTPSPTGTRPPGSPAGTLVSSVVGWSPRTTRRSPRRTPTARSATPPPYRSPTAGPASTSRPPAPTAPTTW